jgi:lysophospholipase L1-like esterase
LTKLAFFSVLLAGPWLACESGARRERPASSATATPATTARADANPAAPPAPSAAATPSPTPPPTPAAPPPASAAAPLAGEAFESCRVALIGDSLTDFRSAGGGFVRYLEQRSPKTTFTNFAKGGAMVNQMRRHFDAVVLAEPASAFTHVIVFGGVNDLYSDESAGRTPAKIETDLAAIYGASKARGWRVVALSVAPWGGFKRYDNPRRRAATLELNAWIVEQRERGSVDVVVDAYRLLSCGDPALLCPSYEPPHRDGLHFGKGGHEVLGEALHEAEFRRCP